MFYSFHSLTDKVLVFGTSDGGSIPPGSTQFGSVAQLVEQCPLKALVRGSSPRGLTILELAKGYFMSGRSFRKKRTEKKKRKNFLKNFLCPIT